MDVFSLVYPDSDVRLKSIRTFDAGAARLEIGTGLLKAGTRMPNFGVSAHSRREITLVVDGELVTTADNRTVRLVAGDVVTVPPGQEQYTIAKRDTRLLWMFLGP